MFREAGEGTASLGERSSRVSIDDDAVDRAFPSPACGSLWFGFHLSSFCLTGDAGQRSRDFKAKGQKARAVAAIGRRKRQNVGQISEQDRASQVRWVREDSGTPIAVRRTSSSRQIRYRKC